MCAAELDESEWETSVSLPGLWENNGRCKLFQYFTLSFPQRQCLTVDRDAPVGKFQEIWSTPLADGSTAVVLANLGPIETRITLTWDMMGWPSVAVYKVRDLWKQEDLLLPAQGNHTVLVRSHNVAMLKLSPVKPSVQ